MQRGPSRTHLWGLSPSYQAFLVRRSALWASAKSPYSCLSPSSCSWFELRFASHTEQILAGFWAEARVGSPLCVIYCYVMCHPKTANILTSHSFRGPEIWKSLAEWFRLRISHMVESSFWLGMQSSQGSSDSGESASKLWYVDVDSPQFFPN